MLFIAYSFSITQCTNKLTELVWVVLLVQRKRFFFVGFLEERLFKITNKPVFYKRYFYDIL